MIIFFLFPYLRNPDLSYTLMDTGNIIGADLRDTNLIDTEVSNELIIDQEEIA